jgi:parallel beta-helix repeat protein
MRKYLAFMAFVLAASMLVSGAKAATTISGCSYMNIENETYELNQSISDGTGICLEIAANNIVLDCRGYLVEGIEPEAFSMGVYIGDGYTGATVKNCLVKNWKWGFYLEHADYNTIQDSIVVNSTYWGIMLYNSSYNNITNVTFLEPNSVTGDRQISIGHDGVDYASGNVIRDCRIDGKIILTTAGMYAPNVIYNNMINISEPVEFYGDIYYNEWNTTRQSGTRIYSEGTEIGGNYWTTPSATGYSDTCADSDYDGFCDEPLMLAANNTDYLPYSDEYTPPTTIEISDCSVLDQAGKTYLMTADITNSNATTCMVITANNVTLDCQGHVIDGIDATPSSGIHADGFNDATTKNCIVSDFENGIVFRNAVNIALHDSESYSNTNHGVWFYYIDHSSIENVYSHHNGFSGVSVERSDYNNFTNVTVSDNFVGFWISDSSDYNNFTENYATGNEYGYVMRETSWSILTGNKDYDSNTYGFYMIRDNNDTFMGNIVESSGVASVGIDNAVGNLLYDNLFNGTGTVYFENIGSNYWNTTRQAGTRIYSAGTEIGGNYWTNSTGNGYSDTCDDIEGDGFCDAPLVFAADNADYLALSDQYGIYLSVTFNYSSVDFGTLNHNTANNPAPNQLNGVYNATVDTGNNYKIEASGVNFTDVSHGLSMGIGNLRMGMNETASQLDSADSTALSESPQIIETDIPSTTTVNFHGFWLSIPASQYATTYTSTVTITYSNV